MLSGNPSPSYLPMLAAAPADRRSLLTSRQVEILTWVTEGKSAWEIGMILGISGRSVDGHLRRIYARLDVRTRLQAVLKAQDLGYLVRRAPPQPAPA
ncbi:helix-turn-helix transcriptional regulator [Phenylobacterium sp.]|jgi:LuxR family quorum-sensing system transcriptional regulator SolR|uniref:response regulator transcription factor n=1 Tax=Phenylobacterium sp. TaxID=1871053 RepID=UPI002F95C274